jgi:hypothetical protein
LAGSAGVSSLFLLSPLEEWRTEWGCTDGQVGCLPA